MLVLMDLEWVQSEGSFFHPTQIAGLRVDDQWNILDRFSALIQPIDAFSIESDHIAYTGASIECFLEANEATTVFGQLSGWLQADDILCWWGDQPALVFKRIYRTLYGKDPKQGMRVISPVFTQSVHDKQSIAGTPYVLARLRNIPIHGQEHCAASDVAVLQQLLQKVHLPQKKVLKSKLDPDASIKPGKAYKKTKEQKEYRSFPYLLDQKTGFLHSNSCCRVQNLQNVIRYTLKSAIQQRYKPCSCCQDEYWSLSAQLTEEVIQRSEYNYIYTWDSKLFHRPSCIHVKRIPYVDLRGSVYYSKCIRIGKKPCGWCKPAPNDQVLPDHVIIPPEAQGIKDPLKNARTCLVIRKMNKAEATAYKRYKIARKERDLAKTNKDLTPEERHDLMTLTNPGFAFWAVPGYQSFHTRSCPNLSRLSGFRGFSSFAAAEMAGFSPCRFCKPSAKEDIKQSVPIYSEERKGERLELLDALCEAKGYVHSFEAPFYLISTPVGEWKLNVQMRPIDVYHINKVLDQDNSGDYHKQHRLFISLQDTFRYINRHDRMLMSKQKKENK